MTDPTSTEQSLIFWALFLALSGVQIFFDQKYGMLRDSSLAAKKPFSFARVQLAWWTTIVLASFISVMLCKHAIPTFDSSTLVLLGISVATTGAARVIDQSDQSNPAIVRGQNQPGENLFLDILSDGTGVNIHRFQTVVFNLVFGVWFIAAVLRNLPQCPAIHCTDLMTCINCSADASKAAYNFIIPRICDNNLILLGLSAGTYAALKTTENKTAGPAGPVVPAVPPKNT